MPLSIRTSPLGPHTVALLAPALLLFFVLSGCEEDVTPVTGTDQPFTIFGTLTPQSDTQSVFLFAVEGSLQPTPPTPIAAQVTSVDLVSGEEWVWQDSLVQNERGQYGHALWAPFTATFGHSYRLTATRPDGSQSTVQVEVPPATDLVLPPRQDDPPALFRVEIIGPASNLIRIEITYEFKYVTPAGTQEGLSVVSYDGFERPTERGWEIPVRLASDLREILQELKQNIIINEDIGLKVTRILVDLIVANREWRAPNNLFDPEILVQPGLLSNVENGFGFLGAGYRHHGEWIPLDTLIFDSARPNY